MYPFLYPPESGVALVNSGWPADCILDPTVRSINGIMNEMATWLEVPPEHLDAGAPTGIEMISENEKAHPSERDPG